MKEDMKMPKKWPQMVRLKGEEGAAVTGKKVNEVFPLTAIVRLWRIENVETVNDMPEHAIGDPYMMKGKMSKGKVTQNVEYTLEIVKFKKPE